MKKEYDFTQGRKNPYAKSLKKQITIRLDACTVDYFKSLADESGISYQNLINLFLQDCANQKKKPKMKWSA